MRLLRLEAALLEIGFAAAAAVEGGGHFFVQGPQISPGTGQTIVESGLALGESGGDASCLSSRQIRQIPQPLRGQIPGEEEAVPQPRQSLCLKGEELPLQSPGPVLPAVHGLQQLGRPLGGLGQLGGEQTGDLPVLVEHGVHQVKGRPARRHLDPGAAPAGNGGEQLDQPDLPRGRHMDAAAGAGIVPRHLHDSDRPGQGPLGPVGDPLQLLRAGSPDAQGDIFPDGLVGLPLDFRQFFRRNHRVKVDDDARLVHVEARIVAAVEPVQDAGDDMLPRVLLHPDEPGLIVNFARYRASRRQRPIAQVDHRLSRFPGIQHMNAPKDARIRRLTAAQRIKGRPVQNDRKAPLRCPAVQNSGLKFGQMAVCVINFFGCHNILHSLPLSCQFPAGNREITFFAL